MEIIRAAAVSRSPGLLLLLSIASSAIEGQGEAQAASDSALRADLAAPARRLKVLSKAVHCLPETT